MTAPFGERLAGLRERLAPRAVDGAFGLGWAVAPWVPRALVDPAVGLVSSGLGRVRSHPQLRANLRQVVGRGVEEAELDTLERRAVESYARYWREAMQLPSTDRAEVSRRTDFTGIDHIRACIEQGRGVVLALPHCGNWDAAAIPVIDDVPCRMAVVVERLEPASLYERFRRYRESLQMEVIPLTGGPGGTSSAGRVNEWLRGGGLVCLLCDRDIGGKGVEVELCGRRTTMPPGPALAAIQTGAALFPTELGFSRDGWWTRVHEELPLPAEGRLRERVQSATQHIADVFTASLRAAPTDWHMFQRVWPDVGPERG